MLRRAGAVVARPFDQAGPVHGRNRNVDPAITHHRVAALAKGLMQCLFGRALFEVAVAGDKHALHRRIAAVHESEEPLTDEQRSQLAEAVGSYAGKTVTMRESVDPAILGGLIVRIGSRQVDTSLRTKLNSLKLALKEVG